MRAVLPVLPRQSIDVRRYLDLSLVVAAAGVWMHVLLVMARHV